MLLWVPHPALADTSRTLCTIRDQRIDESSGLAASGDRLWTVNDGGSRLRVFELDRSCRVLRTVGAAIDPYDVEDLARAADGTLWLADTGDNELDRSTVAVEPELWERYNRILRREHKEHEGKHAADSRRKAQGHKQQEAAGRKGERNR